jgi:hypothetical protein
MGRRKQMPKGYSQRQRDKQKDRWKFFIRKEKKKIVARIEIKGEATVMVKNQNEVVLDGQLHQERVNKQRYKEAWIAEKNINEAWRKDNKHLREQMKGLKNEQATLYAVIAGLTSLVIMLIGG